MPRGQSESQIDSKDVSLEYEMMQNDAYNNNNKNVNNNNFYNNKEEEDVMHSVDSISPVDLRKMENMTSVDVISGRGGHPGRVGGILFWISMTRCWTTK